MKHKHMTSISEETKIHSRIAENFLTEARYDIIDARDDIPYLIKRFFTVGFADPFPDDDKFITGSVDDTPDDLLPPSTVNDRVYPDQRYTPGNSPYCLYIPVKEMMLKLMRACVEVKKPSDLWIMRNCPAGRANTLALLNSGRVHACLGEEEHAH